MTWDLLEESIEREMGANQSLRRNALDKARQLGWPNGRQEAFRFSRVSDFVRQKFEAESTHQPIETRATETAGDNLFGSAGFAYGYHDGHLINAPDSIPKGVTVRQWSALRLQQTAPEWISADQDTNVFRALNDAALEHGVDVHVDPNTQREATLVLEFVQCQQRVSQPRITIHVGANAHLKLIESHRGTDGTAIWRNSAVDILLDDNAHLTHWVLTEEGDQQYHHRDARIYLKQNARLQTWMFALCGYQVRNQVTLDLAGQQASCEIHGLMLGKNREEIENHIRVNHLAESCSSRQWIRGVFDDHAHGVFSGRVVVGKGAQKTDAGQNNRNLLLSDSARVDSMPQLEIYADDVKCQHGSTTGSLDRDAYFYLMARGISPNTARQMLIQAFARAIAGQVDSAPVRKHVEAAIDRRFHKETP